MRIDDGNPVRARRGVQPANPLAQAPKLLSKVVHWELTAQQWDHVGALLTAFGAAAARADLDSCTVALAHLSLLSPDRVTPIGQPPVVPAPQPIRDRIGHLTHELTGLVPLPPEGRGGRARG